MLSKRFVVTMAAAILTFAAVAGAQEVASTAAPRLTMVDPMKDVGPVPKGTELKWDFSIKNTGNADLQIINVQPACGCTVAEFDKVIKPGAIGKVHAVVETAQFSGPISKTITVVSNDPTTPNSMLTMRAVVKPYVEAYPAGFLRYMILQGETATQSAVLYSEEEAPFEIIGVDVPADYIDVKYSKITSDELRANVGRPGQNQWKVDITVGGPDAAIGPIAQKVKLITNSKHQPEYQLSVTGLVRPSYMVNPTVLNFGDVTANEPAATRTVTLKSNSRNAPQEFKVTKVESTTPAVVAESKAATDPGSYEVTVRVATPAVAGAIDGDLRIYTTDPHNPVYTLPVRGSIKG